MSKNDDALQCAGYIETDGDLIERKIAAHIRALVAENEAQAALLRQAVEAMGAVRINMRNNAPDLSGKSWGYLDETIAAIRQHLEGASQPSTTQQQWDAFAASRNRS